MQGFNHPQVYGYGGYGHEHMMGGFGILGALLMLALWAAVIAGIVLLVMWAVRAGRHPHGAQAGSVPPVALPGQIPGADEATTIARRRLATGEITPDEYERIVTALNGPIAGSAA